MLYSKLLDEWVIEKSHEIRSSSMNIYNGLINKHIAPIFGDFEVTEITREMIRNYIFEVSESLKQNTVINITKVLSQSFNFAIDKGYIEMSPYSRIKVPKDDEVKEIETFTSQEIESLLDAKGFSKEKKDMVNIAYRTGMRLGEILSLKWEDINFEQKFLTVRRTLSGYDKQGKPEIHEPKTKGSKRRIDLDDTCIKIFKEMKEKKHLEFIFCKKDGTIYSRQTVAQTFKRMCAAACVNYRCFHSLRHTHASVLLAKGIHPKIVQERLGHSKISTTMDTYSHLIPGMQQVAVDVFNEI